MPDPYLQQKRKPAPAPVNAFLSCSVRPRDAALVNAMAALLREHHFNCVTPGRNVSVAAHPDDAVKQIMERCDCLIGVATTRFAAADVDRPSFTLQLATPYLVQETGAAHQLGMPFLIFKTADITLQGITSKNAFIKIKDELGPTGRPQVASKAQMTTALQDLHARALARSKERKRASFWDTVSDVVTKGVAIWGGLALLERAARPGCFGEFYYQAPECKGCAYKPECKVEKARRGG